MSDHHLTSLNIDENEEEDEVDTSSLMHPSSSDIDNNNPINNSHQGTTQQHSSLQPLHTQASSSHQSSDDSTLSKKKTNLPLLTCCYMSALTTGATTYAFSFYSNALKTSLHLSQSQLDTLSSATFCAGILSWIPGMIVDAWGARNAMALGGLSNAVNLSMYWMIATERWSLTDDLELLILVLSVLGVLIFVGCALVTGSVFKVIVESCGAGTKGKAVGCAKGYVGVGSGVYVCMFGALFGSSGNHEGAVAGPARAAMRRILSLTSSSMLHAPNPFLMPVESMIPSTTLLEDVEEQQSHPELNSLNFLLMAAALSFVAATLPALLLLPKQSSSNVYQNRRDGTRDVHFRVVYAGLMLLGIWVVGVSLIELHEEEQNRDGTNSHGHGSATDLDPSTLNKTLLEYDGYSTIEDDDEVLESRANSYYAQGILNVVRRLTSSAAATRSWGSVLFLLLMWWGPAVSLLIIPARKESMDESITFTSEDENENSFNYNNDGENDGAAISEGEEEIFLQDELPDNSNILSSDAKGEGDHSDQRNFTLLQMLKTRSAWLMAWTTVIVVGGGTVMTNNIGQMTEALGFDPGLTSASLALFSAAQGASRVCTGIASELALKWNLPKCFACCSSSSGGVPRPAFLLLASLVSAVAHFILAFSVTEEVFAIGVTLSGLAFGMVWPMMVLITGEVFGTRHVGANYMFFDGFSSAFGTLLLSKFVAQQVYDAAATDDFKCFGVECFAMTHIIVSLASLTCVASSLALLRSTRDVYQ